MESMSLAVRISTSQSLVRVQFEALVVSKIQNCMNSIKIIRRWLIHWMDKRSQFKLWTISIKYNQLTRVQIIPKYRSLTNFSTRYLLDLFSKSCKLASNLSTIWFLKTLICTYQSQFVSQFNKIWGIWTCQTILDKASKLMRKHS